MQLIASIFCKNVADINSRLSNNYLDSAIFHLLLYVVIPCVHMPCMAWTSNVTFHEHFTHIVDSYCVWELNWNFHTLSLLDYKHVIFHNLWECHSFALELDRVMLCCGLSCQDTGTPYVMFCLWVICMITVAETDNFTWFLFISYGLNLKPQIFHAEHILDYPIHYVKKQHHFLCYSPLTVPKLHWQ